MLEQIKSLLGFAADDTENDANINLLIMLAVARLKMLLGGIDPPGVLNYIIIEVVIARFNRIGSEGLTSHSVEGESLNFTENDFAAFSEDIEKFLNSQKEGSRGKVRFI